MDYTPPGSSIHGILLSRMGCHFLLQWDLPHIGIGPMSLVCPELAGRFFTTSDTWEALQTTLSQSVSSVAEWCPTPWDPMAAACQASLSITTPRACLNSCPLSRWCHPTIYLILCHPLLLPPSIFPSIRVFSNESVLWIRWPKYWSFSFSISPFYEYSGLISFRIDWFDLHAVQRTLKNLLRHHSSKASVLQCSAFFMLQLSHPYMTTWKTIALTRRTFVGKVMSLFFNMLSRFVIAFLPRDKHLLISWLRSLPALILEPKKIKLTASIVSPSICHEVMGPDAMIFVFWTLSFKSTFSLSSFTFTKRLFSSLLSL